MGLKRFGLLRTSVALPLAIIVSACTTAPTKQANIWMGQVAQGDQSISRPVQSWKAMKFTNLVPQQTDFSCGAAALATIFNYAYGRKTTEPQILVNMLKIADPDIVREKGFSLLDMKNYTNAIGMQGEGYAVPYEALADMKVPGIALLNIKGYKHFVVLRKVNGDYVHVGDPALGNRIMTRRDFQKAWNGVVFVIVGEGYDPNTVLRNPPPPLSARRLFEQRSPVPNAEVYDFGLGPAFNFVF
ncbi:C39 family peptidase [Sphingosinicella rhizophila]|uniref:C39 family peptidase n=1 Tax=Sphingosinicella rhizophila TaxID=3050082 RepID=A0ABU3Q6G4_9SPHN|nr:C39 family peptidase [Sphingosinicella sp. GR2756]MDT9598989.1 C39 family peptidase [Sphingosinicella sp. GR2756]